tara:strand:- start:342 stop:1844 length:1503 start_codon:yes stop_codon:yes gene_type:complete
VASETNPPARLKGSDEVAGISAFGAFIPRLRLSRKSVVDANAWFNSGLGGMAKGERAMCNWDEDSVTMAVAAARDCLAGEDRAALKGVQLASNTMPFADRQNSTLIATALNLDDNISTLDLTASQRVGTSGLAAALEGMAGSGGPLLFLAADKRRTKAGAVQELQFGDGAAALLLGAGDGVAKYLGSHTISVDFVDHYRGDGYAYDYNWEQRWIRDEGYLKIVPQALEGLFASSGVAPAEVDHFVMPCVLGRVPAMIAKKAGIGEAALRDTLHGVCGETGVAHPLVMLVDALQDAKAGDKILVVGFGQGCDALLFEATDGLAKLAPRRGVKGSLKRRREETNYSKYLSFNNLIEMERGLRAEADKQTPLTALYRNRDKVLGLIGGRCNVCGTVQFPKTKICVNPNCHAMHSQDDQPFADMPGKVLTWSADHLTYTMDPPTHHGMVQFEEGGRFHADFTDVDEGQVDVAMAMEMVFRIKEIDADRGFRKYFWKAAPVAAAN